MGYPEHNLHYSVGLLAVVYGLPRAVGETRQHFPSVDATSSMCRVPKGLSRRDLGPRCSDASSSRKENAWMGSLLHSMQPGREDDVVGSIARPNSDCARSMPAGAVSKLPQSLADAVDESNPPSIGGRTHDQMAAFQDACLPWSSSLPLVSNPWIVSVGVCFIPSRGLALRIPSHLWCPQVGARVCHESSGLHTARISSC